MDWPGSVIVIVPPQTHRQVSVWRSAGWFATVTAGDPGVHGVTVFGRHCTGVSTPLAAAVAAAVGGNDGDMHGPNGTMFVIGMWSAMLAAGWPPAVRWRVGITTSCDGFALIVHVVFAAFTTCKGIVSALRAA